MNRYSLELDLNTRGVPDEEGEFISYADFLYHLSTLEMVARDSTDEHLRQNILAVITLAQGDPR